MNNNHVYDMLVVGGGPGGYTAALYRNGKAVDSIIAPGSKAEIDRFIQEALAK